MVDGEIDEGHSGPFILAILAVWTFGRFLLDASTTGLFPYDMQEATPGRWLRDVASRKPSARGMRTAPSHPVLRGLNSAALETHLLLS